jgi:hypothetical protein
MKFKLIFFILFLSSFLVSVFGQTSSGESPILPSNSSGEENSALTDAIALEARQSGERLFVIVRLGKGETSRVLNNVRLFNTKSFMLSKGIDKQTAVFAEGEQAEGEGRIEYFLGSKLKLITLAPRNKMPNLTCCEDYMPPTRKNPKWKKRKS